MSLRSRKAQLCREFDAALASAGQRPVVNRGTVFAADDKTAAAARTHADVDVSIDALHTLDTAPRDAAADERTRTANRTNCRLRKSTSLSSGFGGSSSGNFDCNDQS